MTRFHILTLFPEVFSSVLNTSILKNASDKGIIEFDYVNFRDFSENKHKKVDDYPYGGGAGMLISPQSVCTAYKYVEEKAGKKPKTIYLSPRGRVFNQEIAKELSKESEIVLICGHYEGVDQRIIDEICDEELSLGDFVLTGGEICAMAVCDAVARLIPGVLSSEESYTGESHYNGMLEFPQYTRPEKFHNSKVPGVLLSGNQREIEKWRSERAYEITKLNRPDLLGTEKVNREIHSSFAVVYMGNSETNFQHMKMQLDKKNLFPAGYYSNDLNTSENINLVIYDNCYEEPNMSTQIFYKVKLNSFYEFDNIDYSFFTDMDKCDMNGIAQLFVKFHNAVKMKETGNIFPEKREFNISLKGNIPIELYENHRTKFNSVPYEDIFVFETNEEKIPGRITAFLGNGAFCADVIEVKSKRIGKKKVLYAKGLNKFFPGNTYDLGKISCSGGDLREELRIFAKMTSKKFEIL